MLARHKSTDESFAIKIISSNEMDARNLAQINCEIELQARCKNCPNVVRFKEEFTCEGKKFIVMEHMKGGDLQQLLAQRNFEPIPVIMVRRIVL